MAEMLLYAFEYVDLIFREKKITKNIERFIFKNNNNTHGKTLFRESVRAYRMSDE